MLAPVNGKWSKWGPYGDCSVKCGTGVRTRVRLCNNPSPVNGGLNCPGVSSQSIACNKKVCRKFNGRLLNTTQEILLFFKLPCNPCALIFTIYYWKACGRNTKDKLPSTMTAACKRKFSCANLAKKRRCAWKLKGSLDVTCKKTLKPWNKNIIVRNVCRKSCKNCVGTFIIFEKIAI